MGEPIAINHSAIWEVLDRLGEELGVTDKFDCFMKVNSAFNTLMSEKREQNKMGQRVPKYGKSAMG